MALGASRVLTAGADSTITPIFAGTLAALAAAGSTSLGSVAVALALLVGAMLVAGGMLKLGWIANLLSTPVITVSFGNCRPFLALQRVGAISSGKPRRRCPCFDP